jgi:hypothetical protein
LGAAGVPKPGFNDRDPPKARQDFPPVAPKTGTVKKHLLGWALLALACAWTFFRKDPEPQVVSFAHFCSYPLNNTFLILGIGGLLYLAWRERSKPYAFFVLGVILGETAIYGIIKEVGFRVFHFGARPSGHTGGFPSGHAACSAALAFLLTERFPKLALLWYGCAALIGWSRYDAGAHYPYQILAGMLLGVICGTIGTRLWRSATTKILPKPSGSLE